MEIVDEILKQLKDKKDSALDLSKNYGDKSKRGKFRDFAAAYVDAIILVEDIKKKYTTKAKSIECTHTNREAKVSEWHQNGTPDRWETFCMDCGKSLD